MTETAAPQGLLHAILLDGSGGCLRLPWQDVGNWQAEQGYLWLHFHFEETETRDWLEHESGLNDIAVAALITDETRPRTLNRGDNLLLALRGVNLSPGDDPEDMVSLRLWTDGQRLISTRRRQLVSTQDVIEELEAGNGPRNAAELLVTWIDRVVLRMNDTIEQLEDEVLALEERVLGGETSGLRVQIAQLRKKTISLRRYLAPQREAMNRLASENLSWLDEINRLRLRETNDRQMRYIEDVDEIRDRAALAQEELFTRVSEQMNERSYIFTVVATIFLPLGFFTGLMGINVAGMPGVENSSAFWIVVAVCLGLTAALALVFRCKRWL
ncbi:zinc transporter ZntB [Seongchinamella sediminis]|uniref:Zinc transporter ZntB n=1 Tax=Seongchinamella sediminis TaxID=2283635 RepID=A0A3L7E2M9_9GAMM|nr:zinc transporter ZntB [Seongchinamella sediminis]RLQ23030.1 zinc transporter ZntB [Seongchinamella sediminis]